MQPEKSLDEIEVILSKPLASELIEPLARRLSHCREPKRQFLAEILIGWTVSHEKGFSQKDKTKLGGVLNLIGGEEGKLFLDTVWDEFIRFCRSDEDSIQAMEFRPRWPFRPFATQKLFDANGFLIPTVNSNGQMIFWAKNEAAAKCLVVRLNHIGSTYILSVFNQSGEKLAESLELVSIPLTADLIGLIFDSEIPDQSTETTYPSPIAWLLGMDIAKVSSPKISSTGLITKEFTFDIKSGKKGLIGLLSPNPKIKLDFNCNYYPYTECLLTLFSAETSD